MLFYGWAKAVEDKKFLFLRRNEELLVGSLASCRAYILQACFLRWATWIESKTPSDGEEEPEERDALDLFRQIKDKTDEVFQLDPFASLDERIQLKGPEQEKAVLAEDVLRQHTPPMMMILQKFLSGRGGEVTSDDMERFVDDFLTSIKSIRSDPEQENADGSTDVGDGHKDPHFMIVEVCDLCKKAMTRSKSLKTDEDQENVARGISEMVRRCDARADTEMKQHAQGHSLAEDLRDNVFAEIMWGGGELKVGMVLVKGRGRESAEIMWGGGELKVVLVEGKGRELAWISVDVDKHFPVANAK